MNPQEAKKQKEHIMIFNKRNMCYFAFYFIILQNNRVINRMQKKIHLYLNKYIHTIKIKIRNAEK